LLRVVSEPGHATPDTLRVKAGNPLLWRAYGTGLVFRPVIAGKRLVFMNFRAACVPSDPEMQRLREQEALRLNETEVTGSPDAV